MDDVLGKIVNLQDLTRISHEQKKRKKKIVLCHGVFDVVHPGHLEYFRIAREHGDTLLVSVTADRYVNKGPNRPLFSQEKRMHFLASLQIIDYVVLSDSPSSESVIRSLRPDVYAKGEEYRNLETDKTGKIQVEKKAVEECGGSIIFTGGFTSSSTKIINTLSSQHNPVLLNWRKTLRDKFTIDEIIMWLNKVEKRQPIVTGETIVDRYTWCRPLSKSSKDPLLAFEIVESMNFPGGILLIADHCSQLSSNTTLLTARNESDLFVIEQLEQLSKNCTVKSLVDKDIATIIKHRFLDRGTKSKLFETYVFDPRNFTEEIYLEMQEIISNVGDSIIIADYGHGFFSEDFIKKLSETEKFIALNVQTNAGNRGFNHISKYPRADFISLNGGELELQFRSRDLDYYEVVPDIMQKMGARRAILTLGENGLLVFDVDGSVHSTPALTSRVVDKVGAGDAVFASAALLASVDTPIEIIGLVSGVCAAHEVQSLGHHKSLTITDLERHVRSILL